MTYGHDYTADLVSLVQRAIQSPAAMTESERAQLCSAAVALLDSMPADLDNPHRSTMDRLAQTAMDFAFDPFNLPDARLQLQVAVRAVTLMAEIDTAEAEGRI